jgi:glycosyltransferase involved in cell wall biosynthesis
MDDTRPLRVLYSFPHKLGAQRICYAAWQHVKGMANAGVEVTAFPGVLHRPLPANVTIRPTLARGRLRIPYRVLGRSRALALHDWIVSRRMRDLAGEIDIVHTFPLGAARTLETARQLGIPTVLERCNAHTAFAYEAVKRECERLGVTMPTGHEHAYDPRLLRHEEREYELADFLLCPSDFVMKTFLDRGFPREKLLRFQYGFDETSCYPAPEGRSPAKGLTVLFAAGCAPRKGLHYALEAWLRSSAHREGRFLVVGEFIPGYAERLSHMLSHPSVERLGFRHDLPDVMRASDILVLPTIEEGSALVTYDARGCGCVLLVSEASGAVCEHMIDALVHTPGDVGTLARHFTMLHEDRSLLERLRENSLATAGELTWDVSSRYVMDAYGTVLRERSDGRPEAHAIARGRLAV